MLPLTLTSNKVLLEYRGQRIVQHAIGPLLRIGLRDFCFLVGYLKDDVAAFLTDVRPPDAQFIFIDSNLDISAGVIQASKLFPGRTVATLHGNIMLPDNSVRDFFLGHDPEDECSLLVSERHLNDHVGHPYVYSEEGRLKCNLGLVEEGFCVLGLNIHEPSFLHSIDRSDVTPIPEQMIGPLGSRVSLRFANFTMKHFERPADLSE